MGGLLVERAVRAARQVADEVLVIGKGLPPKEFKGAKWVCEAFTGYSPLYGVLTALKEAKGKKVLILPGDCPLVKPEVLKYLSRKEPPAFIEGNFLFALLRKGDFLTVEEMLKEGEHRVRELHRRLRSKEVKRAELTPLDYRGESFKNLNYFKDYREVFTGEDGRREMERVSADELIERVKRRARPENLGMVLVHNGVVRGSSRSGREVKEMELSVNREKLKELIEEIEKREGIEAVEVWINEGRLKVGDDIMLVAVGGRFRSDVLPAFEELIGRIKREVVVEKEI